MLTIEGVNITSFMNKQIMASGSIGRIKTALKKLGMGTGPKGKRVPSAEATAVIKLAKVVGNDRAIYAISYDGEFNIYFYRTGLDDEEQVRGINFNKFKVGKTAENVAHIWGIALGQFDGRQLVLPGHQRQFEADDDA